MTNKELDGTLRRLYLLAGAIAITGICFFTAKRGPRAGLAFGCAAGISIANLWLFNWLSHRIAPAEGTPQSRGSGLFITRYLVLFALGYATVNTLGFDPVPVIAGLFVTAAAVLISFTIEIFGTVLKKSS